MYLLTRVPGVVYTTLAEKDERFLSFSEAVLKALRCGHRGNRENSIKCFSFGTAALMGTGQAAILICCPLG